MLNHTDGSHRVGCAVVTFNPDLDRLAVALEAAAVQAERVLVIDNASADAAGVQALVERLNDCQRTKADFVQSPNNEGLGAAYNKAIAWAREIPLEQLVLLDQDTVLADSAVDALVRRAQRERDSGRRVAAVAAIPLDPRRRSPVGGAKRRVVQTSGCLIRLEAIDRLGPFDEQLFIHGVDQDWFLRARSAEWLTVVEPAALLDHFSGDAVTNILWLSFPRYSPVRFYFVVRNTLVIARRAYAPVGWKIRYLAELAAQVVLHLARSRQRRLYWHELVRGLRDGMASQPGPD
jgi:rhamnosyltransferase